MVFFLSDHKFLLFLRLLYLPNVNLCIETFKFIIYGMNVLITLNLQAWLIIYSFIETVTAEMLKLSSKNLKAKLWTICVVKFEWKFSFTGKNYVSKTEQQKSSHDGLVG